ncbi:hypothetical protein EVAR_13973_1 [Eumeta japonica]|uniref:Uncharacterized protein n=1 Tax=Eumeta variegata TaxID=151549 RepID=A0A4C1U8H9_EUMVA|nr:hypothetical protein EVAR_13973_1 [Eumeta japonica]
MTAQKHGRTWYRVKDQDRPLTDESNSGRWKESKSGDVGYVVRGKERKREIIIDIQSCPRSARAGPRQNVEPVQQGAKRTYEIYNYTYSAGESSGASGGSGAGVALTPSHRYPRRERSRRSGAVKTVIFPPMKYSTSVWEKCQASRKHTSGGKTRLRTWDGSQPRRAEGRKTWWVAVAFAARAGGGGPEYLMVPIDHNSFAAGRRPQRAGPAPTLMHSDDVRSGCIGSKWRIKVPQSHTIQGIRDRNWPGRAAGGGRTPRRETSCVCV